MAKALSLPAKENRRLHRADDKVDRPFLFLILLLLIWSLLPLLRQWGHQLEAMEDSNIHTNYSTNHG